VHTTTITKLLSGNLGASGSPAYAHAAWVAQGILQCGKAGCTPSLSKLCEACSGGGEGGGCIKGGGDLARKGGGVLAQGERLWQKFHGMYITQIFG